MDNDVMYIPKGSMCLACEKLRLREDCSHLNFKAMLPARKPKKGCNLVQVICTEFQRSTERNDRYSI